MENCSVVFDVFDLLTNNSRIILGNRYDLSVSLEKRKFLLGFCLVWDIESPLLLPLLIIFELCLKLIMKS